MAEQIDDDEESVWYRLGYTMEKAREQAPNLAQRAGEEVGSRTRRGRRLRSPAERQVDAAVGAEIDPPAGGSLLPGLSPTGEPWDAVLTAAAAMLAGKLLDAMPRRRKTGVFSLVRAGAAGAGAALLRELLRPMITGQVRDKPLAEAAKGVALAGAARGFLYGGLIDPRIPGPPIVRGAAYGLIEHLVSPWGGLTEIAGPRAPHRTIPFLAELFEDFEPSDDTLVDHLVFGIALASIYGAWGSDDEDEDDDDD
jgi:hypothetical protein